MKTILAVLGGALIVLVAGFFALNHYIYQAKQADDPRVTARPSFAPEAVTFTCGDNTVVQLRQSMESHQVIELTVAGTSYILENVVAASGARYVGGEVEFWERGSVATLRIGAEEYPECIVVGAGERNDRALLLSNWQLVSVTEADEAVPLVLEAYQLSFDSAGHVNIVTDCNNHGGKYRAVAGELVFTDLVSTRMYCEGSGEDQYIALITRANQYDLQENGNLVLRGDGVVLTYAPVRNP